MNKTKQREILQALRTGIDALMGQRDKNCTDEEQAAESIGAAMRALDDLKADLDKPAIQPGVGYLLISQDSAMAILHALDMLAGRTPATCEQRYAQVQEVEDALKAAQLEQRSYSQLMKDTLSSLRPLQDRARELEAALRDVLPMARSGVACPRELMAQACRELCAAERERRVVRAEEVLCRASDLPSKIGQLSMDLQHPVETSNIDGKLRVCMVFLESDKDGLVTALGAAGRIGVPGTRLAYLPALERVAIYWPDAPVDGAQWIYGPKTVVSKQ